MAGSDPGVDTDPVLQLPDARRCEERYHCCVKAIFCEEGKGYGRQEKTWNVVRMEDVSVQGVALLVKSRLAPGTKVTIVPLIPSWSPECKLNACIVSLESGPDDYWRAGCRFTQPLTADQLNVILQNSKKR